MGGGGGGGGGGGVFNDALIHFNYGYMASDIC